MTTDPVCKMEVNPAKAAAQAQYGGQTYYFCSESCHRAFTAEPRRYAGDTHAPSGHAHTQSDSRHRGRC